jgi:transcriptional regulator with XRE-family HTH domain
MTVETGTVGPWIKAELGRTGMTVRDLSLASGISERMLYAYMSGKTEPGTGKLARIMMAFGHEVPWDITSRVLLERMLSDSQAWAS